MLSAGKVLLALVLALLACTGTARFVRQGRRILDGTGRERIFHGVNVVYKTAPYLPTLSGAWDINTTLVAKDYTLLESWGFNMIRLGVMWPGLVPERGSVNAQYLDAVASVVSTASTYGIHALLDLHQDLMSPFFCGEGAPDYLIQPADGLSEFPMPVRLPYKGRPYPTPAECTSRGFGDYYLSGAVGKAFQQLYENANGFQDELVCHACWSALSRLTLEHKVKYWVAVSSYFANNSLVLGYELLNEPWVGDIYEHPGQLYPGVTDAKYLVPMYTRLMRAIRAVDSQHMIFFEPTVQDVSSGFTHVPANDSNAVLSYHCYCANANTDNTLCKDTLYALFVAKNGDSLRLGVPGFMTEFGAVSDDPFYLQYQTALQDSYAASWSYWQYKYYGDITTSAPGPGGAWGGTAISHGISLTRPNGTLQTDKVKALSRAYPEAVQGRLQAFKFDPRTGAFQMSYLADASIVAPTQIFLPLEFYYQNGYTVSVSPQNAASWGKSTTLVNRINVMAWQNTQLVVTVSAN